MRTLYLSRAGEVGRIVDGGGYETLAGGFKVQANSFMPTTASR